MTDLMCLARCSLLLKTILHSPNPVHWKVFAGVERYLFGAVDD